MASDWKRSANQVDFPALEEQILELWDSQDTFAASVAQRPADREYVFYDGPPFPTGSPHYGNLLAGVIKDIVPRYWTMRGHRVERRFGWDTHGLPVEMEVEKQLGLSGPHQIAEFGIDRYNAACRAQVEANTENWERVTRRLGRWVDFRNDYKTMDLSFMESVWWAFKQLWDKGLIYRAFKVLPYSFGASTPLSNFEANLDYRDVEDPAITVRLRILDAHGPFRAGDWLLIWTTTPWTLPGNLAVAVGQDIEYAAVEQDGERHWVAKERLEATFGEPRPVVAEAPGSELVGAEYEPPFDYFGEERDRGAFRIITSDAVTTTEGTGMVHMAPAYGEADFLSLQAAGLDVLVDPIDAEARFTEAVPDVAGLNVKDADAKLIQLLRESGRLVDRRTIRHSYPYCYRTGTPLIYKAIPTWFVAVETFRGRMAELNRNIHWVPGYVGSRRFGNWLEEARDWAISRNRYWGSCLPVWQCDQCEDQVCLGSLDELEALSGERPDDLHKDVVDLITWPCSCGEGTMRRIPEVLDCWFESGSMPYGQLHYPFENRQRFEAAFPAQFIAEGLDQTRGWFYTLVVLSTALFDQEPFENCVVNGLILAEDGRKMSKSLKNYPDPEEILHEVGADALRAYMINSPVLRAEPLRFSRNRVREVVRTVLLPLWNTYSFFTTYAEADGITLADISEAPPVGDRPELDRWVLSVTQSLVAEVNRRMEGYYLYSVVPPVIDFVGDLTNWYVRRSRRRFWRTRGEDETDKLAAFATLYEVLTTFTKVLAPILPFVTEVIYQDLVARLRPDDPVSIHLCDYPTHQEDLIDPALERQVATVRQISRLGHGLRKTHGLKVRQPLRRLIVLSPDPDVRRAVEDHLALLQDELNVIDVQVRSEHDGMVELSAKADFKQLGPRLGGRTQEVAAAIASLDEDALRLLMAGDSIEVAGEKILPSEVIVQRTARPDTAVVAEGELAVALDVALDDELSALGLARELTSRLQQLRKALGMQMTDRVRIRWFTDSQELRAAWEAGDEYIRRELLAENVTAGDAPAGETLTIEGFRLYVEMAAL
jgi:isoleucyl-tRNA synthetase